MKNQVLKDPDTPKAFTVPAYNVAIYYQQRKVEDDVLVENLCSTRLDPLIFINEECKYVVAVLAPL